MMRSMNVRVISAGLCSALLLSACELSPAAAPPDTPPLNPTIPLPTDPETPDDLTDRGPRPDDPFGAPPARVRRLLDGQYQNAVRQLLGTAAATVALPPVDVPLNGFLSVGAAELALSGIGVDTYEASAEAVAAAASVDPSSPARAICQTADVGCYTQIVRTLGRRAWRRTLTESEVSAYAGIGVTAANAYASLVERPFDKGLEFILLGLLQSPHFLYIIEIGDEDQAPEARSLTGAELATRLSFFITDSPPSDALLDAGEAGSLSSPATLEATVRELLARPEARTALRNAFRERLQLQNFQTLNRPDPALTPSVRTAMVEESLRLIDDVVWDRNVDLRELFSTTTTFVNDELAAYYGFALPGSGAFFSRVQTPAAEGRAGLLTRGAFLTRFAHNNRSSPTLRGKFIRENLLCASVPAPPNDVSTTLPEQIDDNLPRTTRDRMAAHMTEPRCAACHETMDPLGFALEHYDQFGRYRTHENGLPIDSSAELDGDAAPDAAGFMGILKNRSDLASCMVRALYRHGTGTIEVQGQEAALYDVDTAFLSSGLKLQEALVGIVLSDAFGIVSLTAAPVSPEGEN